MSVLQKLTELQVQFKNSESVEQNYLKTRGDKITALVLQKEHELKEE